MSFAKTLHQFNLIILEESEIYLLDKSDGEIRILKPIQKLMNSIDKRIQSTIKNEQNENKIPNLIKTFLSSVLEKPVGFCVRLCSKSIILDSTPNGGTEIIKVPFHKVKGVWLLLPDPPLEQPSAMDLCTPVSQVVRAPRLSLISESITRIVCSSVSGRNRVVRPYLIDPGPWIIEIRFATLQSIPKPLPLWFQFSIEILIRQQKLLTSTPDAFFFLLLSAKLLNLFLNPSTSTFPPSSNSLWNSYTNESEQVLPQALNQFHNNPISFDQAVNSIQALVPSINSFPFSNLDHRETQFLSIPVRRQLPLHICRGIISITNAAIYFQPFPLLSKAPFIRLPWNELKIIILRIVDLQQTTMAMLHSSMSKSAVISSTESNRLPSKNLNVGSSEIGELNFIFDSRKDLQHVIEIVESMKSSALIETKRKEFLQQMTELWRTHQLDTFHYLGFLNSLGGRSSEDFSQYPIMPWTYIDFTSSDVDLNDSRRYRNLKLPLGAINSGCLNLLQKRLEDMSSMMHSVSSSGNETNEAELSPSPFFDHPGISPYLYGSHYSTSAYVVYWLSRLIPECQLRLQGGRFDSWPRLFHSIRETWKGLEDGRATSFMELIPEFYDYSNPEFLENRLGLNVCASSEEMKVSPNSGILPDVELPTWAKGNATIFLKVLREALESDYVSENLNHWIDLIFGYKQRGNESEKALNLFHSVTYLTARLFDNQSIKFVQSLYSESDQQALLTQVREFGQCPIQLFDKEHPKRLSKEEAYKLIGIDCQGPNPIDLYSIAVFSRSCLPWYIQIESNVMEFLSSGKLEPFHKTRDSEHSIYIDVNRNGYQGNTIRSLMSGEDSSERLSSTCKHSKQVVNLQGESRTAIQDVQSQANLEQQTLARFKTSRVKKATLTKCKVADSAECYSTTMSYRRCDKSIILGTSEGTICLISLKGDDDEDGLVSQVKGPFKVISSPITTLCCHSKLLLTLIGSQDGRLTLIKNASFSSDEAKLPSRVRVHPINHVPHSDSIISIAMDAEGDGLICTSSLDQVVAFWCCTNSAMRLQGCSDVHDITASTITQNRGILGGKNGEVSFWDFRVSYNNPIWDSRLNLYQCLNTIITDCNSSGLLSSGSFTITSVGYTKLGHSSHQSSLLPTCSEWDVENRCLFNAEVYESFRNPFISPTYKYFHDNPLMSHSSRHKRDHNNNDLIWDSSLLDIRMIGPSSSSIYYNTLMAGRVNLDSSIIGKCQWRSSGTKVPIAGASYGNQSPNSRGQTQHQTITSCSADGCRWAVAIGIMDIVHNQQNGLDTLSSLISDESIHPNDILNASRNYAFCSIADLSRGLRTTEICRWPLMLGSREDTNDLDFRVPTLIAPSSQWELTGDSDCRLCVGNIFGQIELVT